MKLSFTLDEKILDIISIVELIDNTFKAGISAIEISPDKRILPIKTYKEIAKICNDRNIDINYHIPYHTNDLLYEIMNINEYSKDVRNKYLEFINIVLDFQDITNNISTIVFHGAKYIKTQNKEQGLYNTLSFCDWILNHIEKKNLALKLALETVDKKDEGRIGDNREDIHYIINIFNSKNLGICWDICHDAVNFYPEKAPMDNTFLNWVIYCHIHGISSPDGESHTSITGSFIKFEEQLRLLKSNKFSGPLNIELLVKNCGKDKYLDLLFDDINNIKLL